MASKRRIFAMVTMATLAGAALAMERRRARREPSLHDAPDHDSSVHTADKGDDDAADDCNDPEPQLSPKLFTLSHFSLLAILGLMVIVGLSWRGIRRYPQGPSWHVVGGDVERGRAAMRAHGCVGCHVIPGIREATGMVGPPLERFNRRMYIGGQLANTPENLIAWLQRPQHFAPGTAMPNLNIDEPTARDMAAFLYALR